MKIRGVIGKTPVTLDSNGLDYERLVAAIELLQFKINTAQGNAVSIGSLNEVLVVAGASFTKEIEVI